MKMIAPVALEILSFLCFWHKIKLKKSYKKAPKRLANLLYFEVKMNFCFIKLFWFVYDFDEISADLYFGHQRNSKKS